MRESVRSKFCPTNGRLGDQSMRCSGAVRFVELLLAAVPSVEQPHVVSAAGSKELFVAEGVSFQTRCDVPRVAAAASTYRARGSNRKRNDRVTKECRRQSFSREYDEFSRLPRSPPCVTKRLCDHPYRRAAVLETGTKSTQNAFGSLTSRYVVMIHVRY